MSIKVSYKETAQKIHSAPESFSDLTSQLAKTFESFKLPATWGLEYTTKDGQKLIISNQEAYNRFLAELPAFEKAPKIYIVEVNDDYCKIEKPEEVKMDELPKRDIAF
mmetsp:Transcript_3987/g.3402  ORF Transcript_3987/g.3402 Transcript_3987/m.3402 type:complete len:108 (-) Transcript_3987:858-1181(-)